jgi:hypothetical protein
MAARASILGSDLTAPRTVMTCPRSKPTRLQRASSHPETGDPSIPNVYPASKREWHGS